MVRVRNIAYSENTEYVIIIIFTIFYTCKICVKTNIIIISLYENSYTCQKNQIKKTFKYDLKCHFRVPVSFQNGNASGCVYTIMINVSLQSCVAGQYHQ